MIAAFQGGSDAYLKKSISHEVLVKSLDLVMLGEAIFPGAILDMLREHVAIWRAKAEKQKLEEDARNTTIQ